MTDQMTKLLAAASAASGAALDMIEEVRTGHMSYISNVGSGETLESLADSVRLLIEAMDAPGDDANQLLGAVVRFLDSGS